MNIIIYTLAILTIFYLLLRFISNISSKKISKVLGFNASHTIQEAVADLRNAFNKGLLPNSMDDDRYFNIKRMQSIKLS